MAITIGKTATVVLNRFCNLVLKPEPVATGGGGGTWTLNFTGGNCGSINCSTNTETIPESVTLFFYAEPESGAFSWYYIKNGVLSSTYTSGDTDFVVFSTNDTLSFTFAGLEGTGNMIIRENDALGREISNFPIFVFD